MQINERFMPLQNVILMFHFTEKHNLLLLQKPGFIYCFLLHWIAKNALSWNNNENNFMQFSGLQLEFWCSFLGGMFL